MSPSLEGKEDQCFSLWLIEQLWIQNYMALHCILIMKITYVIFYPRCVVIRFGKYMHIKHKYKVTKANVTYSKTTL